MTTTPGTQYVLFEVAESTPLEKPSADTSEKGFSDSLNNQLAKLNQLG